MPGTTYMRYRPCTHRLQLPSRKLLPDSQVFLDNAATASFSACAAGSGIV